MIQPVETYSFRESITDKSSDREKELELFPVIFGEFVTDGRDVMIS